MSAVKGTGARSGAGESVEPEDLTFWEFFSECFVPLNNLALPLKPAHKQVCDVLHDAVYGFLNTREGNPVQYVVINIPPRIGKTKILEALACWLNAYFPDAQDIFTSFSASLVERSIRYIAATIKSEWYVELFGATVGEICNSELVTTTSGGNIYGAGIQATITGFGAGLKRRAGGFIAIDDPAKPTEALSVTVAENVREAFELTLKSRRNSDQHCPIIVCAQRLALDDLCGYILATYPEITYQIKIPALDPVTETSNFPETYSTENLLAARDSEQSNIRFAFWSQMQQEPIAQGGNLIPVDKFHRYDLATAGAIKWDKRIICVDTALKTKEHNDYSVLQLWGRYANRAYLIDSMRGKWESPELLKNSLAFWAKHTRDTRCVRPRFVVEEKAAGTGLVQQMRREGVPVEGIERNIDKVTRVKEILPFVETGMCVLPRDSDAPWMVALVSELAQFRADGKAPHDDQTDCVADSVSLLLGKPLSIFDVMGGEKKPKVPTS